VQLFPSSAQIEGRGLPRAIIAVAVGGAVGASLRWAVGTISDVKPGSWPWATLIVNVLGCLAIGVAANRLERGSLRWDGIVTGLLGGFTTMSLFAVELNDFVDRGRAGTAVAYGAATIISGAAAVWIAHTVTRPVTLSSARTDSGESA
jgi:CrcB protein